MYRPPSNNVSNGYPVSLFAQYREREFTLIFRLCSSNIFELPQMEDKMKGQEVAFGYLINDKFVHKFFLDRARNKGLYGVKTSEGPFRPHVKASIGRRVA